MTRIGLGVEIDNQGPPPLAGADRRQITDDRRLADAAFLVEDHPPHDHRRFRIARRSALRKGASQGGIYPVLRNVD